MFANDADQDGIADISDQCPHSYQPEDAVEQYFTSAEGCPTLPILRSSKNDIGASSIAFANMSIGSSVAISADGGVMAASAPGYDLTVAKESEGAVWLRWRTGSGEYFEQVLYGAYPFQFFGSQLQLSRDGSTALIGYRLANQSSEYAFQTYELKQDVWTATGEPLTGAAEERFGWAGSDLQTVALSFDGSHLAVGSPGRNEGKGAVTFFQREAAGWVLQSVLEADDSIPYFGSAIDLGGNGTVLVVGSPAFTLENQGSVGVVQIFKKAVNNWVLASDPIVGQRDLVERDGANFTQTESSRRFGRQLYLSDDGRFLTVSDTRDQYVCYQSASTCSSYDIDREFLYDLSGAVPNLNNVFRAAYSGSSRITLDGRRAFIYENGRYLKGSLKIHEYVDNWPAASSIPILKGEIDEDGDRWASAFDVSADGRWLLVGAPGAGLDGLVELYEFVVDSDYDGVGNNEDPDDDNDGVSDEQELLDGTDPLDAASVKPPFDDLNGAVYHWANHSLVSGAEVSIVDADDMVLLTAQTGSEGVYALPGVPQGLTRIVAGVAANDTDRNSINAGDALAALKIAVGLNPNPDPDGDGPLGPMAVSPYQLIAADMDQDGKVTAGDALAILKVAVRLSSALEPVWRLVSDAEPVWSSHNNRNKVFAGPNAQTYAFDYPERTRVDFAAVLLGDVDSSWRAPTGTPKLDDAHFAASARASSAPLSIWGLRDSDEDGLSDALEAELGTDPESADTDGDGVGDNLDACQGTAADVSVDAEGCSAEQRASASGYAADRVMSAAPKRALETKGAESTLASSVSATLDSGPSSGTDPESLGGFNLAKLTQPLFLRGDMNDWGTDLAFEAQPDGAHTLSLDLAPGTYGFKIATADWAEVDLGAVGVSYELVLGETIEIAPSRELVLLTVKAPGRYDLRLTQPAGSRVLLFIDSGDNE